MQSVPVSFASVSLHCLADSSIIKSTLSAENGTFSFTAIPAGSYYVCASAVGYRNSCSAKFRYMGGVFEVTTLTLEKDNRQLQEVVIKGKKQLLEQHADRLVVNVSKSSLSAGFTAADVLKRVPGVRVTNERVTLTGKNKLVIMVNGRLSPYQDMNALLRSIPSSTIDRIEVMTNPPVNLDAEGDAVINIILKRNRTSGTGGSISLSSGSGLYYFPDINPSRVTAGQYNPAFTFYHQHNKLTINAAYSFSSKRQFEVNLFERYYNGNSYDQRNDNPITYDTHSYQVSGDEQLDSLNVLSVGFQGAQRKGEGTYHNTSIERTQVTGRQIDGLSSVNDQRNQIDNNEFNISWGHSFPKAGERLQIAGTAAIYQLSSSSDSKVTPAAAPAYLNRQQVNNPLNFETVTADYTLPLASLNLQAGWKSSFANIRNQLQFQVNGIPDGLRSSIFRYNEIINAAYISSDLKLKRWNLKAGVRAEQTNSTGKNESAVLLQRNYIQLFPNLAVTRNLDSSWAISGQYGRRIGRPGFQQQNPFEVYLDPQTYTKGNPLLRPQTTQSLKLSLLNTGQPVFQLTYDRTSDVIVDYAPKQKVVKDPNGNDRLISFSVADNLATSVNYGAQLNFPVKAGRWLDGYGGVMPSWQQYHAYYQGDYFDAGRLNFTFYAQLDLKISPTWSGQFSAYYATPSQYEFIRAGRNSSVDFGVTKSMWQNRGKLSINLFDLWYMDKTLGSITYQDIDVRLRQYTDTRSLIVSFSYNFGISKRPSSEERNTAAEEERKRVKTN